MNAVCSVHVWIDVVVIAGRSLTRIVTVRVAMLPRASVMRASNEVVPTVVGAPESVPVASNVVPAGSLPLVIDQSSGGVPPHALSGSM